VRKLTIPLELIPSNTIPNIETYVNKNVIDLTLKGYNNDPVLLSTMLKIFPNIKELKVEYMLEFPCDMFSSLQHLEVLRVDHFKIDNLQNIKINKLRRLEIGTLYPLIDIDWEGVTTINPQIQEIIIREVSHFNTMTAIKNSIVILLRDLKQICYLKIIQNESFDCLRISADMRNRKLRLSPYAMKMMREIFTSHTHYDAINLWL
jgi:hypothetical protein